MVCMWLTGGRDWPSKQGPDDVAAFIPQLHRRPHRKVDHKHTYITYTPVDLQADMTCLYVQTSNHVWPRVLQSSGCVAVQCTFISSCQSYFRGFMCLCCSIHALVDFEQLLCTSTAALRTQTVAASQCTHTHDTTSWFDSQHDHNLFRSCMYSATV